MDGGRKATMRRKAQARLGGLVSVFFGNVSWKGESLIYL